MVQLCWYILKEKREERIQIEKRTREEKEMKKGDIRNGLWIFSQSGNVSRQSSFTISESLCETSTWGKKTNDRPIIEYSIIAKLWF